MAALLALGSRIVELLEVFVMEIEEFIYNAYKTGPNYTSNFMFYEDLACEETLTQKSNGLINLSLWSEAVF